MNSNSKISQSIISNQRAWFECLLFVFLGLVLRLDFLTASNFVIDSDEAIVGLMAKHITEGRGIPIFYYGQAYMGSLEAITASMLFLVFGISSTVFKITPLLWSLVLIISVYFGARRFVNVTAARIAALGTSIAANGFLTWSIMARGGFIEIIIISVWVVFSLAWWNEKRESVWRGIVTGLVLGLGWWTNNQIVFVALPSALLGLVILFDKKQKAILPLFASTVCFFIGSAPFWYYNLTHDFASNKLFGLAPLHEQKDHFIGLIKYSLPMITGAKRFWSEDDIFPGATLVAFILFAVPLFSSLLRLIKTHVRSIAHITFIVLPWSLLLFSMSKYGFLVKAPRYLLPLVPLFFITIGYELSQWRSRALKGAWIVAVLLLNSASLYLGGRGIPGQPFIYGTERAMSDHTEVIKFLEDKNITKIRTNYWIGYRLAFETKEKITFGIIGEPRDFRIPEYAHGVNEETPLLLAPTQVARVADALRAQGRTFKIENIKRYTLLYDISRSSCENVDNEIRFPKEVTGSASSNAQQLANLFDNDPSTRWGSGAPQRSGMYVRVEFKHTYRTPVKASWSYGNYQTDFPRALEIRVAGDFEGGQKEKVLLSRAGYEGLKFLNEERPLFYSVCIPPRTHEITFTQIGKDNFFDWSMATLDLAVGSK